jgi:rhodanese-related sulfurtransferase
VQQLFEFAGNHPLLIAAAVGLVATIVVTEIRLRNRGFSELSPADAVKLINTADAAVLDVRTQEAYAKGHIINSRHVPAAELATVAENKLKKLRKQPVIAYCDNGMASQKAAAELRRLQFESVFTLKGGLDSWKRDNLPLES